MLESHEVMHIRLMGKMKFYMHESHIKAGACMYVCMHVFMYVCMYVYLSLVGISCRLYHTIMLLRFSILGSLSQILYDS